MDNLKEKSLNVGCNRFADFREKINNICNYAEFKKVGIFEISLSVTKKCVFFGFNFENYTVKKSPFHAVFESVEVFAIYFTVQKL